MLTFCQYNNLFIHNSVFCIRTYKSYDINFEFVILITLELMRIFRNILCNMSKYYNTIIHIANNF